MRESPTPATVVCYSVDAHDVLTYVNVAFARFAEDNEAAGLADSCVGRSLYDFLQGQQVLRFHEDLLHRIRAVGMVRDIPFRCDAPDERRYMLMTATADADGAVHFECRLDRVEPRAAPPNADGTDEAQPAVKRCAWCNRINADDWVELEEAAVRLGLLEDQRRLVFTHGICPTCLEVARSSYGRAPTES